MSDSAGAIFGVLFAWRYDEVASRIFTAVPKWMGLIGYTIATQGRLLHISLLIVRYSLHPCICLQTEQPESICLVCGGSVEGIWSPSTSPPRGKTWMHFTFRTMLHCHSLLTAFQCNVQPQQSGFMRLQWAVWLRVHWYLIMMHWQGYNFYNFATLV